MTSDILKFHKTKTVLHQLLSKLYLNCASMTPDPKLLFGGAESHFKRGPNVDHLTYNCKSREGVDVICADEYAYSCSKKQKT